MLYIRHGEKLYNNGESKTFSLDPELTEKGKREAWDKFLTIVRDFGIPDKIISSPYLRTRETAEIAQDVIFKVSGLFVPIFIDPLVGEYLGNQEDKDLNTCLRKETLQFNPIPPETWYKFMSRLKRHLLYQKDENVWYITHGLVIKMIADLNQKKIDSPQSAEGISLSQKDQGKKNSSIQSVVIAKN